MQSLNFLGLLRHPRLSRLFAARWIGQATDGIFQSALASFVLFSPERETNALNAALAFTVVLLPYSIVGPFIGTVLDRVSRQRAIFFSNFIRGLDLLLISFLIFQGKTGVELTIAVLFAFGINRLILAGLSAGLPLLTDQPSLISANAMAVTGGSILVVLGGGLGFGIRKVFESVSNANHSDAVIILVASGGYFLASLFTLRLSKYEIGPLEHEKKSPSFTQGFIEMRDGFSFLNRHTDALRGIFATAVQRGSLTALLLLALLLERNTFHSPDNPDAGLSGLALALSIAGIGITCGALIAPLGVSRLGRHRWIRLMILLNTLPPIILVFVQQPIPLYIVAFLGSFFGQSLKVTNDALVQSKINDYFRGRVFAVYDVVVNGAIVSGALIAALILPASGISVVLPLMVSAFSLLIGVRVLRKSKFNFVS
ncbi:MAG: MFS transporter [Actinomycetes bacterium]|jgi:MFS family permease|nr:MFS transporter [Actinomycetota bacterium]